MKMRFLAVTVAIVMIWSMLAVAEPEATPDEYSLDAVHSSVIFRITHMKAGHSYGWFKAISGDLTYGGDTGTINLIVDVDSVDTNNEKRDEHVKSAELLNSAEYPTITFVSKTWKMGAKDGMYAVTGDLTFHGVTKEIALDVQKIGEGKDPWGKYRVGFETVFTIKRSEYGMTGMMEGLSDEVQLTVSVEATRR